MDPVLQALEGIKSGVNTMQSEITSIKGEIDSLKNKKPEIDLFKTEKEAIKAIEAEIAKFKSLGIQTPGSIDRNEKKEKAFSYKKLFNGLMNRDRELLKEFTPAGDMMKQTYNNSETASTGAGQMGYFVPEEYAQDIINFDQKYSGMNTVVPLVRSVPMNREIVNLTEYLQGALALKVGAHTTISDFAGSAKQYQLTAKKIATMLFYDSELVADANPAFIAMVEEDARNAFEYRENWFILGADGTDDAYDAQITGILANTDVNTVTTSSSAFGSITYANILDMIDGVTAPIGEGTFVFNKTLRPTIRTLQDGAGHYIFDSKDGLDTLCGYPVRWLTSKAPYLMPRLADSATGTAFGIFGGFRDGVFKGDRMTLDLAISTDVAFASDQVALRWRKRIDYKIFGACFSVIKSK